MKIAHFINDEKFPDAAWDVFEKVAPGTNDFYMPSKPVKLKYVKKIPVIFISRTSFRSMNFVKKLMQYDFVVLHSLTWFNLQLVSHALNSDIKFLWIGMGYDYYDLVYKRKNFLFLDDTVKLYDKYRFGKIPQNTSILNGLKKFARKCKYKLLSEQEVLTKETVVSRIDYFSPVLPIEYNMVKERFVMEESNTEFPKYVSWNYPVNANLVDDLQGEMVDRKNKGILIGNSATLTNNHLEIFEFLRDHANMFSRILCPLSYGNNDYAKVIEHYGNMFFGDKFVSMREFIPYDEYTSFISSCPIVIMNHIRQQAGGNVSAMIYKGASVFLREENPLYKHYRGIGVYVFSVQELENNPSLLQNRLSDLEILENRKKLKTHIGSEAAINKTINLIDMVVK